MKGWIVVADNLADVYLNFQGEGLSLIGECMDEIHPGEKGWIQIRKFGFGFGFEGKSTQKPSTSAGAIGNTDKEKAEYFKQQAAQFSAQLAAKDKKPGKDDKSWGKSGALTFEKGSFSKSSDLMSRRLIEICHAGTKIDKVTLAACRYGGQDKNAKMAFMIITFENVYLTSCNLNLAVEGTPSEDYNFQYEVVRIQSRWTSNATGDRNPAQPIGSGWDLTKQDYSIRKDSDYSEIVNGN